jgi:hypothetical protein
MGLVLFAILFLFGATGMESRRGIIFCIITGVLLSAWVSPLVVQETRPLGLAYMLIAAFGLLIAALLMSTGFFFVGRVTRTIFMRLKSGSAG